jgi:hypothetical protein
VEENEESSRENVYGLITRLDVSTILQSAEIH